jgi:pimeloyl-ACP methyl ester carboxylesterase
MGELATRLEPIVLETNGFTFSGIAAGPADGPLVLFLHGWPEFADSWTELVRSVGNDGYRAVAIDQRGYSAGARPEAVDAYTVDALVGDALGFADAFGRPRFHLVAHDWGAMLGWFLAANHGDRIASYTSLATPHPAALAEARRTDPDQQKRSAYIDLFRAPGNIAEKTLMGNGAAALRAAYEGKFPPEHVDENIRRFKEGGALTASLNWYRAGEFYQPVNPVTVPTLYVWGSKDLALGERAARNTSEYVSGPYRFEVLDGISHWIPLEAPGLVVPLLREHLASHNVERTVKEQ